MLNQISHFSLRMKRPCVMNIMVATVWYSVTFLSILYQYYFCISGHHHTFLQSDDVDFCIPLLEVARGM